ncbi:biotin-dependent carboxyltransferase family protein [Microbulbifer sp. GL-2]|uniref:5-oxoprolinase subunit C family protein n=1 Tax=Microbulbifer sp. GL-2 TaxID=2591606 RepID=UPI0011630084|nr:biotin-dependent carboxyltransferase family protein [Microbulbifer sp. GL-2]BBM00738.1 allophanate hydrolase [Microbulbifer sp. GL-2]
MSIHFIRAGLQTSIQDMGRPGLMHYGIPQGGAADPLSMKMANLLLGNPFNNPVLEITLIGPRIEFDDDISIAITGARFKVFLNSNAVDNFKVIQVKRGDTLEFSKLINGARAYIGFSAKLSIPIIFDSAATHLISGFGGHRRGAIANNDRIYFKDIRIAEPAYLNREFQLNYQARPLFRVVDGAEKKRFSQSTVENFYKSTFQVSAQSNRMGIRLLPSVTLKSGTLGETLEEMISSGLQPGSIQVPNSGEPIISFIEGQTIGGYPRIAHIIRADIHRLGQLKAQDKINFQLVSQKDAKQILRQKQHFLTKIQEKLRMEGESPLTI